MIRQTVPKRRRPAPGAVALLVIAGVFLMAAARADEPDDATQPGMTYASIAQLPDLSGWWYLDLDPDNVAESLKVVFSAHVPLLKPEIAGRFNPPGAPAEPAAEQATRPGYCSPMTFTGFNGGFEASIEFLFTPGRVTITSELGLVRRVELYRPLPGDADESAMGTSVGHWDGSTLVIETTGLDPDAFLMSGVRIGSGASIVERITLRDEDTLEIARRVVAPAVLTGPSDTTLVYLRDRDHVFHEASHCADDDRSVDPDTGEQRFDLTPPSDLPPPPG